MSLPLYTTPVLRTVIAMPPMDFHDVFAIVCLLFLYFDRWRPHSWPYRGFICANALCIAGVIR